MKETSDKLLKYKDSLEQFHSTIKKEEIFKINIIVETIFKDTYKNFDRTKYDIQDLFDESLDIVTKVDEVKNSKIFKIFYQYEKYKKYKINSNSPFDEAYKNYTDFKKSIIEKGPDSQKFLIEKIKTQYEGDQMILKELIALISDEQEKEEIMILFNEKIDEKDINAMYEFFSYFKNNENIIKDLEKWESKCKDFSNFEDITKMKNIL